MKVNILGCLAAMTALASAFPTVTVSRRDNSTVIKRPDAPYYPSEAADCIKWHVTDLYQNCNSIGKMYGVPGEKIQEWNPEGAGYKCSGLKYGWAYCVLTASYVPDISKLPPADCNKWHKVATDNTDSCAGIAATYGVDIEDFIKWNPTVGPSCLDLWQGEEYCVGTESYAPGGSAPGPVQSGQAKNCNKWRFVDFEDTCYTIYVVTGVEIGTLVELNPAVGAGCENMWYGYYMCIGTSD